MGKDVIIALDFDSREKTLAFLDLFQDEKPFVKIGMSGPGMFPLAVRMVYQVYEAVRIPIVGMGGVTSAQDVLELMLAGATAVGVGAANLVEPYACKHIIETLPDAMARFGIDDLPDGGDTGDDEVHADEQHTPDGDEAKEQKHAMHDRLQNLRFLFHIQHLCICERRLKLSRLYACLWLRPPGLRPPRR